jgi:hypothetical protein
VLNDIFQFRDQREGGTHTDNQKSLSLLARFCLPSTDYCSLNALATLRGKAIFRTSGYDR